MAIDEIFMRRALQLARRGCGFASPNPMVGAVVECEGKIIGEGFHRCCGQGHAEVNAIASVRNRDLLCRSTIYVTLEPCSHYGKTPPCSKLIIDSRIPRVVVGTVDPFAKVSGRGIAMLRDAGVKVKVGVLEDECRRLNERFFYAHTHGRPYVQLKWAETADGFLATTESDGSHKPIAVSSPFTQMLMHRERAKCDAIIVGAGTVVSDNPSLSVRLWPSRVNPLRVVLDRNNLIPSDAAVVTDGGCTHVVSNDNIEALLADLYNRNITSVMVEGGANVLSRFIASGCWNEARVERNMGISLGCGLHAPHIDGLLTNVEKHFQSIIYCFTNR